MDILEDTSHITLTSEIFEILHCSLDP